jgi:hypothetical protein
LSEDKCFDQLAVMEERAEAEPLLEELAGEPVDRDLVDAFLDELPAQSKVPVERTAQPDG